MTFMQNVLTNIYLALEMKGIHFVKKKMCSGIIL